VRKDLMEVMMRVGGRGLLFPFVHERRAGIGVGGRGGGGKGDVREIKRMGEGWRGKDRYHFISEVSERSGQQNWRMAEGKTKAEGQ